MAKYLGSATAEIKKVWPDDLAEVTVDGRRAWLPTRVAVRARPRRSPRPACGCCPAMDPLLQARDRDLLVPGRDRQKEVWRILGNPGVVLVDGEIAGVWRAKMAGRKRVDLTVTPFGRSARRPRKAVEAEAAQVARARGVPSATVAFE